MLPPWETLRSHPAFGPSVGGAAALILSLPLLCFDFWFDQGVYATIADSMLEGAVAYRDAWEHRPPGIFYVYSAAFLLLGRDIWAVRCMEILAIALAAAGLVRWGERRIGSRAAGLAAAVLLPILYLPFAPNTAQSESFQLPALTWALALWPRDPKEPRADLGCLVAGLLLSIAVLFKTPASFFAFVLLSDRLACDLGQETWRRKLRLTGWTIAGLAAPAALIAGYYAARGALEPFWDAIVVFPGEYARSSGGQPLSRHLEHSWTGLSGMLVLPELALLGLGIVQGMIARRSETLRCLAALATAWMTVVLQGRYFHYHWIPLLPFLATTISLTFAGIAPDAAPPSPRAALFRKTLAGIGISLAALSAAVEAGRTGRWFLSVGDVTTIEERVPIPVATPWGESRSVARRIEARTGPDDSIFVWGDAPLLYFLSNRRMAGPYAHLMTIAPEWRGPERVHRILSAFAEEPPRLVVMGRGGLWWRRWLEPAALLDSYPDMKRMLHDRYRKAETVEGFELWVRTD